MRTIKEMTQEAIDTFPGDIAALREVWSVIIDGIILVTEREKPSKPLPDSRNCKTQITGEDGYKRCTSCVEKLCSVMYGTKFCMEFYEPMDNASLQK